MADNSEAKGLLQIASHSYHTSPKGNTNQFWTSYTTYTANSQKMSTKLFDDALADIRKQINRQVYGDNIGPAPVNYGDHIVRKGIRDLSGADYSKLLPYT